jgi:5-methylcytosine-specific restriction protein A
VQAASSSAKTSSESVRDIVAGDSGARIYHWRVATARGIRRAPGVDAPAREGEDRSMATYVFAWNPRLWGWPELERERRRIASRGHVDVEWACGRTRAIEPGSRAFFVRVGVPPKGLIGAGYALTAPWEDAHWLADKAAAGVRTHYLKLRLECLRETPLITLDELARPPFRRFRWAVRQSGTRMPSSIADALEPWWEERAKQNQ